jgi:DNA-binding NarL/FixJ family response regulator
MQTTTEAVARGRDAYARQDWTQAYEALAEADGAGDLGPEDLRRLASAATLNGREEAAFDAWERAHRAFLDADQPRAAVRCAFWLGMQMMRFGQHAPGGAWLGRAQRVLDESGLECVEQGYLLTPRSLQQLHAGDAHGALEGFERMTAIADRFGDPDLSALGRLGQGQALVALGRPDEAVVPLDEAMIGVTSGDVSPIAAGIVYCGVIISCQEMFDWRRAQEWTTALIRWCKRQQGLEPYRGQCLIHRSQISQLRGDWQQAMAEVEEACSHLARPPIDPVMGMARYQQAELLRLRGDLAIAEEGYRQSSEWGHPVQPGLALLRLAQGRIADANAAVRSAAAEVEDDAVRRPLVLYALVEIALAAGDADAAGSAVEELAQLTTERDTPYLHAVATSARGAVLLAEADASGALEALRPGWRAWQQVDAPYEAARVRVLIARAYLDLGDPETAGVELAAARATFEQLGAEPDLERLAELAGVADGSDRPSEAPGGLTPREVEVLRLLATGATNREIADALVISEKTVARHLSNTYTKLGLSTRAAATAWAYEHGVV